MVSREGVPQLGQENGGDFFTAATFLANAERTSWQLTRWDGTVKRGERNGMNAKSKQSVEASPLPVIAFSDKFQNQVY